MTPGGIILTRMIWDKRGRSYGAWAGDLAFNVILLAWQLAFLTIGKLYGKFPGLRWSRIWRAATYSHVRLCLKRYSGKLNGDMATYWYASIVTCTDSRSPNYGRVYSYDLYSPAIPDEIIHINLPTGIDEYLSQEGVWSDYYDSWGLFVSFGWPKATIKTWRPDQVKGRFEYRDPTFTLTDTQIEEMNRYAFDQIGKPVARKYDWLQLLSAAVNLVCWIVYPPCWGDEVSEWFNLPGGREFCSSGVTACLRWVRRYRVNDPRKSEIEIAYAEAIVNAAFTTMVFPGYSTSMVSPCLFAIDKSWREG